MSLPKPISAGDRIVAPLRDSENGKHGKRGGIAYLLQVFPKYSETFVLNELLEHQRRGRPVPVLSLRLPREGRFHGYLAELEESTQYIPESLWEQPRKVREALWSALKATPGGARRVVRHWMARQADFRDVWQAAMVRRWATRREIAHVHCHFGGFAATVAYLSRLMGGPMAS